MKTKERKMKSRFSIWKMSINGSPRWGVNGVRDCGTYTVGPHNGYCTRKEAAAKLAAVRKEERDAEIDRQYLSAHPESI